MTPGMMQLLGEVHRRAPVSLSDESLEDQIEALNLVIAYLQGRGERGILVSSLRQDHESYERMHQARLAQRNSSYE